MHLKAHASQSCQAKVGRCRKRPFYPLGLSTGVVSKMGAVPKCSACHLKINHGSKCFVCKTVKSGTPWTLISFYHFQLSCITQLSPEHQLQAMTEVSSIHETIEEPPLSQGN